MKKCISLFVFVFLVTAWKAFPEVTGIFDYPAGSDTQVQYNDNGLFGGSANFTFNGSTVTATKMSASTMTVTAFRMPTGAVNNYILRTNASGFATWVIAGSGTGDAILAATQTFTGTNTFSKTTVFSKGISSSTGAFSGAITATTLNTGNGANELFCMDQNERTTDSPTHANMTLTYGLGASTGVFTGALTAATINTGHGANESYAMNQDVTTFSTVTYSSMTVNHFRFPTGAVSGYVLKGGSAGDAYWASGAVGDAVLAATQTFSGMNTFWKIGASTIQATNIVTNTFKMATGASSGYVLQSDASGKASWGAASSGTGDMILAATQTVTGQKTFTSNLIVDNGATTADGNIMIGQSAGNGRLVTGEGSVGIGFGALDVLTSGEYNYAIGAYAGGGLTVGNKNIAIGDSALYVSTQGVGNVNLGYRSGYALKNGSYNVFLGYGSGSTIVNGSNNVLIGEGSPPAGDYSSRFYLSNWTLNKTLMEGDFTTGYSTISILAVDTFRVGLSTTSGYVLTADSDGRGTWKPASGGGDAYLANDQTFTGDNTFSTATVSNALRAERLGINVGTDSTARIYVRGDDGDASENIAVFRKDNSAGHSRTATYRIEPLNKKYRIYTGGSDGGPDLTLGTSGMTDAITISTQPAIGVTITGPIIISTPASADLALKVNSHFFVGASTAGIESFPLGGTDNNHYFKNNIGFWIPNNRSAAFGTQLSLRMLRDPAEVVLGRMEDANSDGIVEVADAVGANNPLGIYSFYGKQAGVAGFQDRLAAIYGIPEETLSTTTTNTKMLFAVRHNGMVGELNANPSMVIYHDYVEMSTHTQFLGNIIANANMTSDNDDVDISTHVTITGNTQIDQSLTVNSNVGGNRFSAGVAHSYSYPYHARLSDSDTAADMVYLERDAASGHSRVGTLRIDPGNRQFVVGTSGTDGGPDLVLASGDNTPSITISTKTATGVTIHDKLTVSGKATFSDTITASKGFSTSTGTFSGVSYYPDGSVTAPSIAFSADTNTGLYRFGTDTWAIAAAGAQSVRGDNYGIMVADGLAVYPSYSFVSDGNSGFYSAGADSIGIAVAGVNSGTFATTGFIVTPPAVQTVTEGATITANACGTVKELHADANVTTNTTNTFTAPSAALKGCVMFLVNNSTHTIRLDINSNFVSDSASSYVEIAVSSGTATVLCNGTKWYESH